MHQNPDSPMVRANTITVLSSPTMNEFSLDKLVMGLKSKFPELSVAKLYELIPHIEIAHVSKKEFVIKQDLYNGQIFFVAKGLFRAYYERDDAQDTFWFREENTLFASHYSILTQQPSKVFYQALEDSVVVSIPYKKLKELAASDMDVSKSIITVMEGLILELITRIEEFTTLQAEERYYHFLKRYEAVAHRIPQQYAASYIGVTPSSFSRLKSQLSKK